LIPRLRIYLDTSVPSAYYDTRYPERMAQTRKFWNRLEECEVALSEETMREIQQSKDPDRREQMLRLVADIPIQPVTQEDRSLASIYIDSGIFTAQMQSDAIQGASHNCHRVW